MNLRPYQVSLNAPTEDFLFNSELQRGQVYAPTGAGKTVCFLDLINKAVDKGFRNIAILHPRIALSQDQLRRFKQQFSTKFATTSFHSGQHVTGSEEIAEVSTTERTVLLGRISGSIKPHITFSSYHSFHKLTSTHFDLIICDEAHYLIQDRFGEYLGKFTAGKILFYTATPVTRETVKTDSMDITKFGPVIAQVAPRELIEGGYIVAPLVFRLSATSLGNGDRVDPVDLVARAYSDQYTAVIGRGMPFCQMLVVTRDVANDIGEIENRLVELWNIIAEQTNNVVRKVDVYTIASDRANCNGRPVTGGRDAALCAIKSSGDNAIVVHYDTLSEGIDIDTLGGVFIMRDLSPAKLIQTIGRAARPYVEDLNPVTYEPLAHIFDLKNKIDLRKKARCIITFPIVDGVPLGNIDGYEIARAFIIGGYGDLTTYLGEPESRPEGKPTVSFDVSEEDLLLKRVIDHEVESQLVSLNELLGI